MTQEIAVINEGQDAPIATITESPRAVVDGAVEQADVLMEIVKAQGLYVDIQGKMYLEAEAWELILAFNRVIPATEWTRPVRDNNNEIIAVEAKVRLLSRDTNLVVGSGIMRCGLDSFPTRGKRGQDAYKAAESAAQTWVLSKAARMSFSYVAAIAGFQPTPASEMSRDAPPDERVYEAPRNRAPAQSDTADQGHGICEEHGVPYFQRGKMRSPAHPIGETGKWCNKPDNPSDDAGYIDAAPPSQSGPTPFQVLQSRIIEEYGLAQETVWPTLCETLQIGRDEQWHDKARGDDAGAKINDAVKRVGEYLALARRAAGQGDGQQGMDVGPAGDEG